jgi:hypothetical protein
LLYVTNTQAYQQKTEKFFVSEEKSFIGSATGHYFEVVANSGLTVLEMANEPNPSLPYLTILASPALGLTYPSPAMGNLNPGWFVSFLF